MATQREHSPLIRALQTFSAIYAGGTSWRSGGGVCAIVERVAMLSSQMKAAKKAVRMSNADPFDYGNPDRLKVNWPPRALDT